MPLPASINPITVTGTYLKPDGTPESGFIRFRTALVTLSSSDNTIISVGPIDVELDANGQVSIEMIPTDDPDWTPQGWTYYMIEDLSGRGGRRGYFELHYNTAGLTIDIADINLVTPVEGGTVPANTYIPLSQKGANNGVATLGSDGKVPEAQLPVSAGGSGVDSVNSFTGTVVLTPSDIGAAPATGSTQYAPISGSANYIASSARGAVNGVASLDGTGKVPSAQLPAVASGVDSVNGASGTVVLTFSDVDALSDSAVIDETLIPRQLEILEAQTFRIDRPDDLVNPGTAADMLACYINGRRTGYFNEEGYIRCRARNDNDVSARFQGYENAESTSPTTSVFEVTNSSNALVHFKVTNGGNATVRTDLAVGGSATVSGTLAVTGNVTAANLGNSSWTAFSSPASGLTPSSSYDAPASSLNAGTNRVSLRGRYDISSTVTSGTSYATITSGHRPLKPQDFSVRLPGTSPQNVILTVNTDGTITASAGSSNPGSISFSGISYSRDA